MSFDGDIALLASGDGVYQGNLRGDWWTPRGPLGGYVMAVMLRGLELAVDDPTRLPRSLTMHFLRPPQAGPIQGCPRSTHRAVAPPNAASCPAPSRLVPRPDGVPAPWPRLRALAPAPTIDLTIHFRAPLPIQEALLLGRFRTRLVRDGFFDESRELWAPDGTLVAQSRQLGLLIGAEA